LVSKFNILPSIFALPTNEAHVLTYYICCAQLSYPPTHLLTYPPFYLSNTYMMSTLRI
jgi:hypothetical protein